MQSTPSSPSHPGSLWPGSIAPDRVLSMGKIELFDIKQSANLRKIELLEIELFIHLTKCKQIVDV